jgi:hypothetical protein
MDVCGVTSQPEKPSEVGEGKEAWIEEGVTTGDGDLITHPSDMVKEGFVNCLA